MPRDNCLQALEKDGRKKSEITLSALAPGPYGLRRSAPVPARKQWGAGGVGGGGGGGIIHHSFPIG